MQICFIDASSGTFTGGSENIIYNLCLELSKRHTVILITGKTKEKEILPYMKNERFKVVMVPFISRLNKEVENIRSRFHLPLQYDIEAISFSINLLRNKKLCSFINSSNVVSFHYPMTSLIFSWYLKIRGIPSVFHAPGDLIKRWFFKFNRSTLYLVNSLWTEEQIFKLTSRHADGVVTPGVAMPNNLPMRNPNPEEPVLLSVSRLSVAKGVYRLLEIFYYIKRDIPGVKLLLVGQNFEGEGILNKAKELGLEENIHLEGEVPYSELGKYYAKADLFVHTSYAESFGMVLLEAMSYNLPVVAADLPCFKEVTKGAALHLVYEDSYNWSKEIYILWAKEIINLLRDPNRQERMKEIGKKISISYTWDKKALEYEYFLNEAIRRKKKKICMIKKF